MDVFEIIQGEVEQKQQPQQPPIQKTEDKIDLSSYVITPQKTNLSKRKIYKELENHIYAIARNASGSLNLFKEYLSYALYKKIDFSKPCIIQYTDIGPFHIRLIDYALDQFVLEPHKMLEAVKYLLANVDDYKTKMEVENRLYHLISVEKRYHSDLVRSYVRDRNPDFMEVYKLLLQHGVTNDDALSQWFNYDLFPLAFDNMEFLSIMLEENNPKVIARIEQGFYRAQFSEKIYPTLKKYNFKFNEESALETMFFNNNYEKNIKFLVEKGELDVKKFTTEKIHRYILGKTDWEQQKFWELLEELKQIQKVEPEKKYADKKQLSAKAYIDQIFENANDAIESQN